MDITEKGSSKGKGRSVESFQNGTEETHVTPNERHQEAIQNVYHTYYWRTRKVGEN